MSLSSEVATKHCTEYTMFGKNRRNKKKQLKDEESDDEMAHYPVSPKIGEESKGMNMSFGDVGAFDNNSESSNGWSDASEDSGKEEIGEGVLAGQQKAPDMFDFDDDASDDDEYRTSLGGSNPYMTKSDSGGSGMGSRPDSPTQLTPTATRRATGFPLRSPRPGKDVGPDVGKSNSPNASFDRVPESPTRSASPVNQTDEDIAMGIDADEDIEDQRRGVSFRGAPVYDENGDFLEEEITDSGDVEHFHQEDFKNARGGVPDDESGGSGWTEKTPPVYGAEYPDADSRNMEEGYSQSQAQSYMNGSIRPSVRSQDSVSMDAFSLAVETQKSDRRLMMWLIICLGCSAICLALVAGGVVGATMLSDKLGGDDDSDDKPAPSEPSPTPPFNPAPAPAPEPGTTPGSATVPPLPSPTSPPTLPGSFNIRNQALYDTISSQSSDGGASIQKVGSPQNLAYKWLEGDSIQEGATEPKKLQRYALATLFFSTGTEIKIDGVDECVIFGCEMGVLADLELTQQDLGGVLPPELGLLSGLTRINLSANKIGGKIPVEIGSLGNLLQLNLSENQLTGAIPTEIGQLQSARGIWLNGNQLTGPMPDEFGNLQELKGGMDLSSNLLTGTIPPSVAILSEMKIFSVHSNKMNGKVPDFSALVNLREFRINGNGFTGVVPAGTCAAVGIKLAVAVADCPDEVDCACCTECCNNSGVCTPAP